MDKNLADKFVIILDDCERVGEQETVDEIKKKLDLKKIEYGTASYKGTKKQTIIFSKNLAFLKTV